MRPCALLAAALVFVLPSTAAARRGAAQQTAEQIAVSLQAKYDRVRDFTADFTQEYQSGVLRKKSTERGKLQIKKPGKMRWDYTAPEKKQFVSDGSRIYLWVPADNTVTVSDVPKQDEATTALQFLTGRGQLLRDFTITFTKNQALGTYGLRLDPKLRERDYDWLELGVDHQTMQIRTLTAADRQGGQSTFTFTNFKENVGLSDTTFTFKIPRGADVINAGGTAR
jgi:outer membrane lipoprotein carrier protein